MQPCKSFFLAILLLPALASQAQWKKLFNGRDLTNWDSWLRATTDSGYSEPYHKPIGLNNDPLHVFTVHDGMLHVSGEVWGAVTYKESFGNYHLRFKTRWGKKKYAPKDTLARDGGLLFHCTGPFDYAFNCWMRSAEMQVQEGEIGDFFNVGAGDAEFPVRPAVKTMYNETADQYDATAAPTRHPGRVYRSGNFERPGEWTVAELVARQADAVFIVNGFVVNRLYNLFRKDLMQQVTSGKIQFQSEGAEQYYRDIEIRPVSFVQSHPKLVPSADSIVITDGRQAQITVRNEGEPVELIAAELIGERIEQFQVKLPKLPMILTKGATLTLPVSLVQDTARPGKVLLRLETVLGPVSDFEVRLISK